MMVEQGFPNSHTQTNTVTITKTSTNPSLRFDPSYIRTIPGILKCAEIALNLLGFICIISSNWSYHSRGSWFNTVAMGGFWFTGIMLAFYLFHVVEKFSRIPWYKIEFVFCALWTIFYLIAAALAADFGFIEAFAAAAFFGFCAMICYGFDAFLSFQGIKTGQIPQGERVVSQSTTSTTTPAY